jgi:hypothetical protein
MKKKEKKRREKNGKKIKTKKNKKKTAQHFTVDLHSKTLSILVFS